MADTLGQRLKARRLELGFGRREMAEKAGLGLSQSTIQRLEMSYDGREHHYGTMLIYAEALEIDLDALLT